MGRIENILDLVGPQIATALNAAGLPPPVTTARGQIYIGWPTGPELTEIVNQKGYAVTMYPNGVGKKLPPRGIYYKYLALNPVSLTVTITTSTITFSGSVTAGLNVYAYAFHPQQGLKTVYYKTLVTDTPSTVALAVKNLLSGLPYPLSFALSGTTITSTNAIYVNALVTSTGTAKQMSVAVEQIIQISVWASDPFQRAEVTDAFWSSLGSDASPRIGLGDGTSALFRLHTPPKYVDESQQDYNLYESHTFYSMRYQMFQASQLTQIGEIVETVNVQPSNQTTVIIEG